MRKMSFVFCLISVLCLAFIPHGLAEHDIGDAYSTAESVSAAGAAAGSVQYNEFEWKVLAIMNRERLAAGAQPLTISSAMQSAADVRAVELETLFSHTRPDGSACFTALSDAGVSYMAAGENIAIGYQSPEAVMAAWMKSPGHRSNIVFQYYRHVGVGYYKSGRCWEQIFASVRSDECTAISLEGADNLRAAKGTSIDDMGITVVYQSAELGRCVCPLIKEMCTGYDENAGGVQTVTVGFWGVTAEFTVTEIARPAEKVILDKETLDIDVLRGDSFGQTRQIKATLTPSDCDAVLAWSSSDLSVATVDANGLVTIVGYGKCEITAAASGDVKAKCKVNVNEIVLVETITPETDTLEITVGEVKYINATVSPFIDVTNAGLTWVSSNPKVAKINDDGRIKGVSVGTAVITITAKDGGGASAQITVRVVGKAVKKITLNKTKATLNAGQTLKLKAAISPSDADKGIVWSSSDSSVATVNAKGKVKAVAPGKCKITATSTNGVKAVCRVTVKSVKTTSIKLNKEKAKIVIKPGESLGKTLTLKATVKPDNATDARVTWLSSDITVATVDENGAVTSVGVGKCTITAKASGGQRAKCKITVSIKP